MSFNDNGVDADIGEMDMELIMNCYAGLPVIGRILALKLVSKYICF